MFVLISSTLLNIRTRIDSCSSRSSHVVGQNGRDFRCSTTKGFRDSRGSCTYCYFLLSTGWRYLYAQLIMTQTHSGLGAQTLKEIEQGKPFRVCDFLHSVTYMQPTFLAFIRTLLQRNSILPWTFQRQRRCLDSQYSCKAAIIKKANNLAAKKWKRYCDKTFNHLFNS